MISSQVRKLTLPIDAFDRQLLPASVRGGKPAVRHDAMSDVVRKLVSKAGRPHPEDRVHPQHDVGDLAAGPASARPGLPHRRHVEPGPARGRHHPAAPALERPAGQPDLLYNLGMALSDAGKLDEAIDYLSRLREVDPTHVNGRVALGVALLRNGDDERGIEALEQAVALEPGQPVGAAQPGRSPGRERPGVLQGIEHLREATGLAPRRPGLVWPGAGAGAGRRGQRGRPGLRAGVGDQRVRPGG